MQVGKLGAFMDRVEYFLKSKAIAVLKMPESYSGDEVVFAKRALDNNVKIVALAVGACTNGTIAEFINSEADANAANTLITDNDLSYVIMTELFPVYAIR